MPLHLDWHGDEILKRLREATRDGIDETMGLCVNGSKERVPVITATYQGSIRFEPATIQGDRVRGQWGSFDVGYALKVETGRGPEGPTKIDDRLQGGRQRQRIRTGQGKGVLRGQADAHYPDLPDRIRARFQAR